jgi:hypothetical protein
MRWCNCLASPGSEIVLLLSNTARLGSVMNRPALRAMGGGRQVCPRYVGLLPLTPEMRAGSPPNQRPIERHCDPFDSNNARCSRAKDDVRNDRDVHVQGLSRWRNRVTRIKQELKSKERWRSRHGVPPFCTLQLVSADQMAAHSQTRKLRREWW